jgi:PAS domain S-box-containing protein
MLLIVVFTQVLRQFRETQDYVVTVTQQKRNLQEARAELIQLTQELDYERYLLHTLLDTVSDRIIFKDLGGRYTRVSKAVAEQFGVPLRQVRGQTDFDFFAPDYARAIKAEERQLLQSGEAILDKVERENWRDGRPETWAIKSRILLKGEDDKVVGWLGTARDITEVKKAQEADRRHAQQLSATAEVGRAVTSSLDLQTLLRVLVELVQETFGYYGVNVWLLSEPPDLVQLRAGFSPQGEDLGQMEIQISMKKDKNITAVCRSGEYRLAAQVDEDEQGPDIDRFPKARAQLLLPLQIAEKKLGALEILSDQPNAFQADDVILLQSLADQLTIAIRNASLYEIERQRRHLAETLYQVGRALSRTLNLEEVLDLILEQLDEIVPADRLAVMLVEADELEFMATRGFPAEVDVSQLRMMIRDDSIFGAILRTQEPLPIPDVKGNPDWQAVPGLPQARSWMGVPLIRSDKVVGMLSLTRERLDPYSVSEVTLARTFAGQAVLALENARLYDNLARFSQQLEEMVQERTEELQLAYEQLERLDRTKSDFIKVTSHELRTPLTVLQGYSQMLISDSTIASNEMLGQLAQGIQTGAERMHDIVNGMLDIAKIDSRSLDLSTEPVSLSYLLKSVNKAYDTDLIQRQLQMYMDGLDVLPPIEADSRALYKVFFHLVGNAIKYTPDRGQIVVLGRVLEPETDEYPKGWVEIVVSDTGIGIDPEFQELIFIKFFQTGEMALHSSGRTKFKGGGPGLGLPIARGIIQAHQGRLWVESPGHDEETCPGSHFHVVLPVRQKS